MKRSRSASRAGESSKLTSATGPAITRNPHAAPAACALTWACAAATASASTVMLLPIPPAALSSATSPMLSTASGCAVSGSAAAAQTSDLSFGLTGEVVGR